MPGLLIQVVGSLLIAGAVIWLLGQLPGIDPTIKGIIRAVIIFVVVVWLIWIMMAVLGGGSPRGWPLGR